MSTLELLLSMKSCSYCHIAVSDCCSRGEAQDTSGPNLKQLLCQTKRWFNQLILESPISKITRDYPWRLLESSYYYYFSLLVQATLHVSVHVASSETGETNLELSCMGMRHCSLPSHLTVQTHLPVLERDPNEILVLRLTQYIHVNTFLVP